MKNLDLYNQFKVVPNNATKPITGGRLKGFTDINSMWRIKALTEAFGPAGVGWYFETADRWEEPQQSGEVLCFVKIKLFVCYQGNWSFPIEGTGGSKTVSKEKTGLYADDEAYKKATTDAIGSACKLLGIGADVYWDSDRTKYTTAPPEQPLQVPQRTESADDESKNRQMIKEAENSKIDANKWRTLASTAAQKGITWQVILKQEGLKNGADMTVKTWKKVMDRLNQMPDVGGNA